MADQSISGDLKDLSLNRNGVATKKYHLVVCFGEMLIDFIPTVSGVSLAEAPAFEKAPGGAPANVAVCISKLGGSSAFIGKVGEDEFGRMLADILKKHNVDNSGLRFDHEARTALAFVTLTAEGEREFVFFRNPSADMLLRESELDVDLIKKATIFHYGSISLIDEPCRSTQLAAMDIAKRSGSILSYDPNLRLPLWPSEDAARSGIMSVWNLADIIKISEDEISFLTGADDPNDDEVVLKRLFHPNLKLLLVTEGSAGCRYYTKEFKGRVNSIKVKAVDTTGAGDAFTGGILKCLASDTDLYQDEKRLREAIFFANVCAALTVTGRGGIPSLPTQEVVQQTLTEIIEQEQLQLRKYIDENYSKIRDVEKELANLNMEMKLTAGPKKAALEHMRKKIEMSTEKIRIAKLKEEQARKAWEAASKAVKDEEFKQKLCEDLNNLVRESSNSQLTRLEELKRKLEALNPSRASTSPTLELNPVGPAPSSMTRGVSSVQGTQESSNGSSETTSNEGNARNAAAENGQNQQSEARGKKLNAQGRGKVIGIIPKSRGAAPPGWKGAGFAVDGIS